jgi:alkylation response protein AidB-like acyl-CoA dehydrogenase
VDFSESDEHLMLRAAVREIASDFGHSYFVESSRNGGHLAELWTVLGDKGFLGVNVGTAFGGGGGGITELAIVCEELSAQGLPMLMIIVSSGIGATVLEAHGTDEQKRAWLPGLTAGTKAMSFAITEPNAGLNSHKISTVAVREGDTYRINGAKYFISGIDRSDAVLLVARTGVDEVTGRGQLSLFIVPSDAPGLTRTEIPMEIVSGERQFSVFFDDVIVPVSDRVGDEGEGLRQVFTGLNPERILTAAVELGIARYALEKAAAYATDRVVWDVPIGAHQGISHPLAKCKIELEQAALMTARAGWLFDQGADAGEASNMAKYAAAEAALGALDQAIQTHGGNGLTTEYGLATLWGVCRVLRTAPVSREMILNFVAQQTLGLPRSY